MKPSPEKMKARCDALLVAMLGPALAPQWWTRKNAAFDMITPELQWDIDPTVVYEYLIDAASRP